MPKKFVLSFLVASLAAFALVLTVGAVAGDKDGKGEKLFRSVLAPSAPTDPAFHGRTPGGVPWSLTRGDVRIKMNGTFDLRVKGLVITGTTSPRPVTTISASLFCGADANTTAAVTTTAVPISEDGDARIHQRVALPAQCLAPIVLVHPNANNARWIAISGWKS